MAAAAHAEARVFLLGTIHMRPVRPNPRRCEAFGAADAWVPEAVDFRNLNTRRNMLREPLAVLGAGIFLQLQRWLSGSGSGADTGSISRYIKQYNRKWRRIKVKVSDPSMDWIISHYHRPQNYFVQGAFILGFPLLLTSLDAVPLLPELLGVLMAALSYFSFFAFLSSMGDGSARNRKAVMGIKSLIRSGRRSILVSYGHAHIRDLYKMLQKEGITAEVV